MSRPHVKPEIQSFERKGDGSVEVVVDVSGFKGVPKGVSEIRARTAALTTSGVSTPPIEVLDNVKLGRVKRFTNVKDDMIINKRKGIASRRYRVVVDRPY